MLIVKSHHCDGPFGPGHAQSSREDAPEMIPNPAYATNVSIIAPEIDKRGICTLLAS